MTSPGLNSRSARSRSSRDSTRWEVNCSPAFRSSRLSSSASSGESSTKRMRNSGSLMDALASSREPVQQQPIEAQLFHGLDELVELNRLGDVAVASEPVALHH